MWRFHNNQLSAGHLLGLQLSTADTGSAHVWVTHMRVFMRACMEMLIMCACVCAALPISCAVSFAAALIQACA